MNFDFDPEKQDINVDKHGLTFEAAPLLFEGPFVEEVDDRFDYGETRFVATGPIAEFGDRICVVVYMWRDGVRRIISFRKANDKEVRKYRADHD
jgi:uncharacterized protein